MQVMLHQFSFYKSVHLIINLDFYLFSDTIIDLNDFDKNVSSSISNLSEKRKFPECNFHFFSGKNSATCKYSFSFFLLFLRIDRSYNNNAQQRQRQRQKQQQQQLGQFKAKLLTPVAVAKQACQVQANILKLLLITLSSR